MSFFSKVFGSSRSTESYHTGDSRISSLWGGAETSSGEKVDGDSALTYSAVWCATRVLVESVASLPLVLYRRDKENVRKRAKNHAAYGLLLAEPNDEMEALPFRECITEWMINDGNGYAEIERDAAERPVAIWPIHPSRVRPHRETGDKSLVYDVCSDSGQTVRMSSEDILHFKGVLARGGLCGKGIIAHARESIGASLAAEKFGSSFFRNSGVPSVVIHSKSKMDTERRADFRREWKEIHSGATKSGEVAILPEGAEVTPLTLSQEDNQFLETRQHNVQEVARWYRVPPHLLGDLSRATFTNIEHQSLEFIVHSLRRWLVAWEMQCWRKLLTRRERASYYYEHLVEDLLRTDIKSRYEAYRVARDMGLFSLNELRAKENAPSIGDAGDVHIVPANMLNVESLLEEKEVTQEPVESPQPPQPPPEEEHEDSESETVELEDELQDEHDGEDSATDAARHLMILNSQFEVFRFEGSRMVAKACNAISRHCKRSDFLSWMDEFFSKFAVDLTVSLKQSLCLWISINGGDCDAERVSEAIGEEQVARMREELLELSGEHTPATFQDAVANRLNQWKSQVPASIADAAINYHEVIQ